MQYFILHKPYKMLSQFHRFGNKKCLSDINYTFPTNSLPVGRLDENSEGLLIITTNRKAHHFLLHPDFKKQKTYWVQVKGKVSEEWINEFLKGVTIKNEGVDYLANAVSVKILNSGFEKFDFHRKKPFHFETSWIEIILSEGKNRQIRKMVHKQGAQCLRLIRIGFGELKLGALKPGEVKEIPASEFEQMFNLADERIKA